jgi:hypothetical protein
MLALWPLSLFVLFRFFRSFFFLADASLFCAEAVGASTKEHRLREAIFNYGRELKAEANALREVAQGLAQAPAIGQTAETKQAMIRSLIKIGKLTANLMQGSLSFSSLQPRMSHDSFLCWSLGGCCSRRGRRPEGAEPCLQELRFLGQGTSSYCCLLPCCCSRAPATGPAH